MELISFIVLFEIITLFFVQKCYSVSKVDLKSGIIFLVRVSFTVDLLVKLFCQKKNSDMDMDVVKWSREKIFSYARLGVLTI